MPWETAYSLKRVSLMRVLESCQTDGTGADSDGCRSRSTCAGAAAQARPRDDGVIVADSGGSPLCMRRSCGAGKPLTDDMI